jgi:hypothetical protein
MLEPITKTRFFDPDARYRSNDGKGPLLARMVDVTETAFVMEHWHPRKHSMKTKFELPIWFLLYSPSCGWKRIQP